jgi:hypothetical protein
MRRPGVPPYTEGAGTDRRGEGRADMDNLLAGWIGVLAGVVVGAILGLFFHRDDWMGGYDGWRRRLTRLGHVSFFGLGFVNILFGLTARAAPLAYKPAGAASRLLVLGAILMPLCCFLAAWRKPLRHLFPLPVASVAVGLILLLWGWPR